MLINHKTHIIDYIVQVQDTKGLKYPHSLTLIPYNTPLKLENNYHYVPVCYT